MSFNDDQISYMKYLSTVKPEAKCYCGWYMAGECYNCNRADGKDKTLADRLIVQCKGCDNYPHLGGKFHITHRIGCTTPEWQPTK